MLALQDIRNVFSSSSQDAWSSIIQSAWQICSQPLPDKNPASEVLSRDRATSALDLVLSSAAWSLWLDYYDAVELTTNELIKWWASQDGGRAVLILDGLSLREAPWIIEGAKARGYKVTAKVTCSELPGDTNSFAKALSFGQRGLLENNRIQSTSRLPNATSDSSSSNWVDCVPLVGSQPNWIFWHHWPDNRIHELGSQSGRGLSDLVKEVAQQLSDESFWSFIERLCTGRNLVITSDHGYASTGYFPEVSDSDQAAHLKTAFSGKRHTKDDLITRALFLPPLELTIAKNRLVLGRRRWKLQGGSPSLSHGGLTVLECASPFIQLTR